MTDLPVRDEFPPPELPRGETRDKLEDHMKRIMTSPDGDALFRDVMTQRFPGGCPRGQVAPSDSILTKARKYVELCDGPIYPDFKDPPGAMLSGEEAYWVSHRYGGGLGHCHSHHLEQLAAIHGLYYLAMADSEDCRLDLLDSHRLGIRAIDGECRPGLVAVQGALASAPDRNWTNLALFITRTPPFGDDVDRFPPDVQKFAEQNGWAGLTPDQHHPKYLAMMQTGPIGLLSMLCCVGGPHPCLDRLLDHPRCSDILERLLSFISRCPGVATAATREQFAQLNKHPCFALAVRIINTLRSICENTKKGRAKVEKAVKESQRLDSSTKKSLLNRIRAEDWKTLGKWSCVCGRKTEGKKNTCSGCRSVAWCSPECLKRHWKWHKTYCQSRASQRERDSKDR